jgi:hypothetical protein
VVFDPAIVNRILGTDIIYTMTATMLEQVLMPSSPLGPGTRCHILDLPEEIIGQIARFVQ